MPGHDAVYHRLFNHPGMVAQLLREFVAGPWLDDLDLDGMERLNAKFHADTSERRDGDMISRIPRRGGGDTYLVLLLEFQSTPDHWMALRVLVYAGLLWQHLVKEQRLPRRRQAAADLAGCPVQRRPALMFRLESFPDPEQIVGLADALVAWFVRYPGFEALRSIFAELLGSLMGPLAPGIAVPEELLEVRNMLATRAETWKQQWLQEGRLEGRQEGRREGRQEGEAALLVRQLERRFGVLPGWARDRIATADTAALEEWGLRIIDARNLDDVLG